MANVHVSGIMHFFGWNIDILRFSTAGVQVRFLNRMKLIHTAILVRGKYIPENIQMKVNHNQI